MATVIDITKKIKNEQKFIVYNGKNYKVDDSKNTMTKVFAILDGEKQTIEMIENAMKLLIGKEAVKDFDGFSFDDFCVPFFACMACVQNKTYEEIEDSFRS